MTKKHAVVIIGGGVIGLSIAAHLAEQGGKDILLLEGREVLGAGTTAKASGGIRHQFAARAQIECTLNSMPEILHFEARFGVDLAFRPIGYLMLASSAESAKALEKSVSLQRGLGFSTEVYTQSALLHKVPGLNTEGVQLATFCGQDGVADPNAMVMGYAGYARAHGVEICEGVQVEHLVAQADTVQLSTTRGPFEAETLILAPGPYGAALFADLGLTLPISGHRKMVFFVTPPEGVGPDLPLVIEFPSGWYMKYDAGLVAMGMSLPEDPVVGEEQVDMAYANRVIAHGLHRFPPLAAATLRTGIAGLSDATPDHQAVVDQVSVAPRIFVATGFSGHGFQHAPVVGQGLAEWVLSGAPRVMDFSSFKLDRFTTAPPSEPFVVS